jgi:hypothetical protein
MPDLHCVDLHRLGAFKASVLNVCSIGACAGTVHLQHKIPQTRQAFTAGIASLARDLAETLALLPRIAQFLALGR